MDPKKQEDPNFRPTGKNVLAGKHQQKTSGFSQNHDYLDGTGWKPEQILTANNISSEYRNRFNPEKDFHRKVDAAKERKLKKHEMNYQYNY